MRWTWDGPLHSNYIGHHQHEHLEIMMLDLNLVAHTFSPTSITPLHNIIYTLFTLNHTSNILHGQLKWPHHLPSWTTRVIEGHIHLSYSSQRRPEEVIEIGRRGHHCDVLPWLTSYTHHLTLDLSPTCRPTHIISPYSITMRLAGGEWEVDTNITTSHWPSSPPLITPSAAGDRYKTILVDSHWVLVAWRC